MSAHFTAHGKDTKFFLDSATFAIFEKFSSRHSYQVVFWIILCTLDLVLDTLAMQIQNKF